MIKRSTIDLTLRYLNARIFKCIAEKAKRFIRYRNSVRIILSKLLK